MKRSTCNQWLGRLTTLLMAFALSSAFIFAQTKTVTGTVVDELGEPVIGANVIVAGTTNGATTDIDGNFSISNVADNATLNVSFIGYTSQSVPVNGRSQITVTLSEDSEMLDDVVVIGYQTVRRKDLTGSVASVNNKALAATPVSNVAQALQGQLAQASNDYNALKMARMIEITDSDLQGAKDRLSKLIREVNKCISMLQGEKA